MTSSVPLATGAQPPSTATATSIRRRLSDDTGSAVAEFVFVGVLLTALTLAVLQLALALHIRNTLIDAAAEGARFAALADNGLSDGEERTRQLVTSAIGDSFAGGVRAVETEVSGHPTITVTVLAPLPLVGLLGAPRALEVSGRAAVERVR